MSDKNNLGGTADAVSCSALDPSCAYTVCKLQLFFEYLTVGDVVVTRPGFVRKDNDSEAVWYIDAVCDEAAVEKVYLHAPETHRKKRTALCDHFLPDRLLHLPGGATKEEADDTGSVAWRQEFGFLRQVFASNTLQRAIAVRLEPESEFRRTRVLFYWRLWVNSNPLDIKFVHWFKKNADKEHRRQVRAVAKVCKQQESKHTGWLTLAVARRVDENERETQEQSTQGTTSDEWMDRDDKDSDEEEEEKQKKDSAAEGHRTWLENLPTHYWSKQSGEYYLFTFDATAFRKLARHVKKSGEVVQSANVACSRGLPQTGSRAEFRLERHLHNGHKQFLLAKFLSAVAKHLQRCTLIDAVIAPTFAATVSTTKSDSGNANLDAQRSQCVRFLRLRQIFALQSDSFATVWRLHSIQIADSGWLYLCESNMLAHDMSDDGSASAATTDSAAVDLATVTSTSANNSSSKDSRRNGQCRERLAGRMLCVRSRSADPKQLYDTPNERCGLGWLQWRQERVRSIADRFTLIGGSCGLSEQHSVMRHLLIDCERYRGAFHRSMLAKRSIGDECDYRYLSNRFKTHGLSLQTFFTMMNEQGNDESNVPTADPQPWSGVSSTATLIVCNEYDVWRWLWAISALNERDDGAYVGQSFSRSNVFHVTSADDGRVRMRVHVLQTLEEYQRFTFASLLTSDVVVVTAQLLAQMVPENCSYLSGFRFDEAVVAFERDDWMECVRHQMNCTQSVSLARLCARNAPPNNVPLEAVFWRCIVYDSPSRREQDRVAYGNSAIERKLALKAFENFARVAKAAHLIAVDSLSVPCISDCQTRWRHCLTPLSTTGGGASTAATEAAAAAAVGDSLLPKDFLLRCGRRFEPSVERLLRCEPRRQQTTIYIEPVASHLALLQTVFDLECQLQDLQALVYDQTVHVDGAFRSAFRHRYPETVCHKITHLKASFRYALHACEQNWRIAPIAMRNLSKQILQRSARFLSQNNVEYSVADRDPQIAGYGGAERIDAAVASQAFHAMLRFRQHQTSAESAERERTDQSDTDSSSYYSTETSDDGSSEEETNAAEENGDDTDDDDDDDDAYLFEEADEDEDGDDSDEATSDGLDESDMDWLEADPDVDITDQERLMLGSLIVNYGGALVSGRRANRLWDANIETRMATALDNESDRYDFVHDRPSLYASVQSGADRAYLDEFDNETGIGWSRCLDRRMLLQRCETLPVDEKDDDALPYQICFTSVADRQLVSFVNLIANSKRLPTCALARGAQVDGAEDRLSAAAHSLSDYDRYYAMLEPATLAELTEDGEGVAPPLSQRESGAELAYQNVAAMPSVAELDRDASLAAATPPSAVSASVNSAETQADVAAALAVVGDDMFSAWRKAAECIANNSLRLEQHYIATRLALKEERLASGRLLCAQIRILVDELMRHPQRPLVVDDLLSRPLVANVLGLARLGDEQTQEQTDKQTDEQPNSETIEAVYSFYADVLRPLLSVAAMRNYQPLLSPNLAYCCEQVSKLRRNTRWLSTDLEFVERQLDRLEQSRSNVQQTLGRIEMLTRVGSVAQMSADDRGDCAICLESCVGKDVALYPCGHWCCWHCHKNSGDKKHRVEQDDDSYIGASQSGRRCAFCRYVLQRFESVQRVRQSTPKKSSSDASPRQQQREQQQQESGTDLECAMDEEEKHSGGSDDDDDGDSEHPPDAKRARTSADALSQVAVDSGLTSAFVKCERLAAWLQKRMQDHSRSGGLRCAVISQYAVQLRELHAMLQDWIETKNVTNVCLLYCPSAEQAIERQSSDWFEQSSGRCEQSSDRCEQSESNGAADQGESVERAEWAAEHKHDESEEPSAVVHRKKHKHAHVSGKRKRFSERDLDTPSPHARHIIVLQHVDVTRNLRSHEHAMMNRFVPPIHGLSHLIFCESLCLRLQNGGDMVERLLQLEQHLLAQIDDGVEIVRFITLGGVDEYLHDSANRLDEKQRTEHATTAQYERDVVQILNAKKK